VMTSSFSCKHSMCSFIYCSTLIWFLHSDSSDLNAFSYSLWATGIDTYDDTEDAGDETSSSFFYKSRILDVGVLSSILGIFLLF
jgi:hypothetical protein